MQRWLLDRFECEAMRHSEVSKDMDCLGERRGLGREKEGRRSEQGVTAYFGEDQDEARGARLWRSGRFEQVEGEILPWIWPMRRAFKAGMRKGRVAAAACLRACVEGGWWGSAKLHLAKAVARDTCRCGKAADTMWHRVGRRERTEEKGEGGCPREVLQAGRARVWDLVFSRGVPARPKVPPQPKPRQWVERLCEEAEFISEGIIYTDGSAEGWFWKGARAAYSAVCYSKDGKPMWVMRGICGEPSSINQSGRASGSTGSAEKVCWGGGDKDRSWFCGEWR